MRQFILDSLTLFYDAWFRPTRLQQRLNEWIPPEKGKQDTSWWKTIILPTSRPAWRIWLLCLPWWLVGAFLAVGALWDGVSSLALLFVGAMLILVGWGTSVWSPTLGLAVPALLAVVWSAQPATLQVALERSMNVLSKYLAWRTSPLIWFTALAVGLEGAYWAVSTRRWRLARVIGHVASYLAGDMALLLAVGVALGVTLGVAFGVAGGMALFVAVVLAFVVAFVTAFTMMATASSDAALCVAVAGGVALGVALVLVLGVAGLAVLLPGPAWSLLGLVAAALGRRPRWWGALLVACSLAALRVESAGWWDAAVVLGLALLAYYRLPWQVAPWLAGHRAYFSARHWTTGYEIQAVQPAPAGVGRLLSGVPPFSDETARVRVPHLDDLLALAARADRAALLEAVATVAQSRYQAWAAPRAYAQIAADSLACCHTLAQVARAPQEVTWLPEDLSLLPGDVARMWPVLLALSRDVDAALQSDSPITRRLGLSHAQDGLNGLRQRLFALDQETARRWQPVVERWGAVLARELERPLLAPGVTIVNPYDAGQALSLHRAALFRGRQDLIAAVAGALLERNRPTLVLHGPRRTGKTSLLLQLPRLLPGRTVPVFVDLQRPDATVSAARFFYTLARAIVSDARSHSRLPLPAPDLAAFEREPFSAWADWLDVSLLPALEAAGGFNLLLNLDEFEVLGHALEAGRVDLRVLDELRHTIQHRQSVGLLFAGVQTLEELGPHWSSYFINVHPLRVGYLSREEAAGLVRDPDPQSGFNLQYADEAVADILSATRCHPYLVQLVCSEVVNRANVQRTLLATPPLVRDALAVTLERGELYFRNLWDEAAGADAETVAAGRRILREVAAATGPLPVVADVPAAACALERLLRYDVLERVTGGVQFQVPLVRRWVRERAPVA